MKREQDGSEPCSKEEADRIRKSIGDLGKGFAKDVKPIEGGGHDHGMSSARTFEHNGKKCVIKTHYEITVDGEELGGHFSVDQRGRVHYHGLPNYSFPSAVDLVKAVLDASKYELDGEDELAEIYEGEGD